MGDIPFRFRYLDDDPDDPRPFGEVFDQTPPTGNLWSGSSSTDWTAPSPSDPIGDLREGGAVIFLNRSLTPFERIIVRQGLADSELLEAWYRNPGTTPAIKPEP
jgi:hypothetical protein